MSKINDEFSSIPDCSKRWRLRHPEKAKEIMKEQNKLRRTEMTQWYRTDRLNNPEKYKEYNRKRKQVKRRELITLLGGKCANPYGIDHSSFELDPDYVMTLQVDHINGGGNKQIKSLGPSVAMNRQIKEIKNGSKDYQLLCPTCNWLKRVKNREVGTYI